MAIPQRPKPPRRPVAPTVPATTPPPAAKKRLSPALIVAGLLVGLAVIGYLVYTQFPRSTQVVTSTTPTPNASPAQSPDKSASDDKPSNEGAKKESAPIPSLDIKKKFEETEIVIANLKRENEELRNGIVAKYDAIKGTIKELPTFSVSSRLTPQEKTLLQEQPKPKPFPRNIAMSDNEKKILGQQAMPEYKTNAREYLPKDLHPYLEIETLEKDLKEALKIFDTIKMDKWSSDRAKRQILEGLLPYYKGIIEDIKGGAYESVEKLIKKNIDTGWVLRPAFDDLQRIMNFPLEKVQKHFQSYIDNHVAPFVKSCKILYLIDGVLKKDIPQVATGVKRLRQVIDDKSWENAQKEIVDLRKSVTSFSSLQSVFQYIPDPRTLLSDDLAQKEKVINRLVEGEKQITLRLQVVEQDTEAYNKMISAINAGRLEDADKVAGALARQSSLANDIAPYRVLLAGLKTEQTAVETERKKIEQENAPILQVLQRLDPLMAKLKEQSLATSDLSGLESGDLDEIRTLLSKHVDLRRTLTAYQNYLMGLQALSEKSYEKSVRHLQAALQSKEGFQEATEALTVAQYHHLEQQRQIAKERKAQAETYMRQGDNAVAEARKAKYGETKAHWQKAVELFSKAIEIDNANAAAYRQRGLCRSFIMDVDGAVSDIRKATELAPAMKNDPETQKILELMQKAAEGKAFAQGLRIGAKVAATFDYSDLRDLRSLPDNVVESTIESAYQGYAPVYGYEAEPSGSFRDGFFKGFKDAARIR